MKKLSGLVLAAGSLLFASLPAQAQVTPSDFGRVLSNAVTLTVVASNLAGANSAIIPLVQGKGIAFTAHFGGSQSTNTGTIWFGFAASVDGTNFTTTWPITWSSTVNATTGVRDATTIPPTSLQGYRFLRCTRITNALVNMDSTGVTNFSYAIPKS